MKAKREGQRAIAALNHYARVVRRCDLPVNEWMMSNLICDIRCLCREKNMNWSKILDESFYMMKSIHPEDKEVPNAKG